MNTEVKKHTIELGLGNLALRLTGEQYDDGDILDTKVEVSGENLCYITWSEKEASVKELNEVIKKYRI